MTFRDHFHHCASVEVAFRVGDRVKTCAGEAAYIAGIMLPHPSTPLLCQTRLIQALHSLCRTDPRLFFTPVDAAFNACGCELQTAVVLWTQSTISL
eukprot:CAMPEP_0174719658 /NCGR_PEP_ID=MMETSP1094-20130205/31657_1 /TAXON_ID=156173 /ORGANISM="Chrysochromulina brevifilum, Strain UTEX LB 985" /LENGTH=95 /DNA_ID=CAMNT_0015919997 /DNA_START=245 /DNA_END=533 /DNA_ORIENTATION=-